MVAHSRTRKPPTVAIARSILAKVSSDALTSYSRAQRISSEHPHSADTFVYDWPTTAEPPAADVRQLEIRLEAHERQGDTPWHGALVVFWIHTDGRTTEAFSAQAIGMDTPRIAWTVADAELQRAAVTVTWLLFDAARYKEAL